MDVKAAERHKEDWAESDESIALPSFLYTQPLGFMCPKCVRVTETNCRGTRYRLLQKILLRHLFYIFHSSVHEYLAL